MKIRMLSQITGTRAGIAWPPPGGEVTLPDNEAAKLCASGNAEPVAVPKKAETRPAASKAAKASPRKAEKRG